MKSTSDSCESLVPNVQRGYVIEMTSPTTATSVASARVNAGDVAMIILLVCAE